jgi:hypothetical protein
MVRAPCPGNNKTTHRPRHPGRTSCKENERKERPPLGVSHYSWTPPSSIRASQASHPFGQLNIQGEVICCSWYDADFLNVEEQTGKAADKGHPPKGSWTPSSGTKLKAIHIKSSSIKIDTEENHQQETCNTILCYTSSSQVSETNVLWYMSSCIASVQASRGADPVGARSRSHTWNNTRRGKSINDGQTSVRRPPMGRTQNELPHDGPLRAADRPAAQPN